MNARDILLHATKQIAAPAPEPLDISFGDALAIVAEKLKADPQFYTERFVRAIGRENLENMAKERRPIAPAPFPTMVACEVAIARRKTKGAKRTRADQAPLEFSAKITVLTSATPRISQPAWIGGADFRTPERAAKDAAKWHAAGSISDAARSLIDGVIAEAMLQGWLIGFIREKTGDQGMPFTDRQLIVAGASELANNSVSNAYLICVHNSKSLAIQLPAFVNTTSTAKPLTGGFVCQSRGIRHGYDQMANWSTGELEFRYG